MTYVTTPIMTYVGGNKMEISKAVKEFLIEIEIEIRKYTPKTIRSYRNNLNLFLRFLQEQTDVEEMEGFMEAKIKCEWVADFILHNGIW